MPRGVNVYNVNKIIRGVEQFLGDVEGDPEDESSAAQKTAGLWPLIKRTKLVWKAMRPLRQPNTLAENWGIHATAKAWSLKVIPALTSSDWLHRLKSINIWIRNNETRL